MNNNEQQRTFTAKITRDASTELTKQTKNGESIYVLHEAVITQEGPLKGKGVTCQRTLINSFGQERAPVTVGQDVILYARIVSDDRGEKVFFDISTTIASDDEILALVKSMDTETVDADQAF